MPSGSGQNLGLLVLCIIRAVPCSADFVLFLLECYALLQPLNCQALADGRLDHSMGRVSRPALHVWDVSDDPGALTGRRTMPATPTGAARASWPSGQRQSCCCTFQRSITGLPGQCPGQMPAMPPRQGLLVGQHTREMVQPLCRPRLRHSLSAVPAVWLPDFALLSSMPWWSPQKPCSRAWSCQLITD